MKQHELAMNIKKWQVTKTVICTVALYYGFKKVFYFKIISVSHEHFLLRFSPMLAFSTLDFSVSLSLNSHVVVVVFPRVSVRCRRDAPTYLSQKCNINIQTRRLSLTQYPLQT